MPSNAEIQQRFEELVVDVRPELFRYCARMTGSVFDGEDVVQETLAKAQNALAQLTEPPMLRPWLFRIAHNTAMDFLKRYERKHVDLVADIPESVDIEENEFDPELIEAALAVFASLPPVQRSAVVLKDVLGHSLAQLAATMGTSVGAAKAALFRGRANIAARTAVSARTSRIVSAEEKANVRRYADLFNARDWEGLRALLGEQAQLDLVSGGSRRGAAVAGYYSYYAALIGPEQLRAEPGLVDGVMAIAVFRPASATVPSYFIRLEWEWSRVSLIRDYRYVPYIANGSSFMAG